MAEIVPRNVLKLGATLGEGPVWHGDALWFVDIKQRQVHRFAPDSGRHDRWDAPAQVGWVLPARGGMLAGLQTGIHRFDPQSGAFALHHAPEPEHPGNRLNDATVAPDGSLWFGSMDDGEQAASGQLYRLHATGAVASGLAPVEITNGPAFAPDGRTLYHTDTLGRRIWVVPVNDDNSLGTPRLFAQIDAGYPDGTTVDAHGCVWTGLFGGWAVRRYSPQGELMASIPFPVANITKIAFGGPDLTTAYATTAAKGLDAAALAAQPEAGDLFAFDAGVAGLPVVTAHIDA